MSALFEPSDAIYGRYMDCDLPGDVIQLEYIWIGGSGHDLRSKSRTWTGPQPTSPSDLPIWNFDGSSTGQAPGHDSEVLLQPIAIFRDPFRGTPNLLVLCECLKPIGPGAGPIDNNTRHAAKALFDKAPDTEPWFGLEQEYTLFHLDKQTPLGWPKGGYPDPQGPYYCGVGADHAFGRKIMDAHYRACLCAGLKIGGTNGEVLPSQWEFQIGPSTGIDAGDHLWVARYILHRVCEDFGVIVSFDPKPVVGDWNGSGCHTNYSTREMRLPGGYAVILDAIVKLGVKHMEHMTVYGQGNERRLTGKHETADMNTFSYGVANRGASIRIPRETEKHGCGYLEDRRPSSNCDPYIVTSKIFETTVL